MYKKVEYLKIKKRLEEPRRFIQVLMGPRQVGKSTVVKQVLADISIPYHFYLADNVPTANGAWISNCWAATRSLMDNQNINEIILVIDEIQKIRNWSEVVKKEWDTDTFNGRNIKVLLLGSSRVMLEKGLADSLAGRFEEIRMTHWSYLEMKECFGFTLEQYIFYGGFPGAAPFINDYERYFEYVEASIINATVNKDILNNVTITKPALLKQTLELSAAYSGQLLSLNKMLGQLQDAGNTSTLASYLNLLEESGLVTGLHKFCVDQARKKSSIPKLQVFNNALKMAFTPLTFHQALADRKSWGHIFESAIGSYLVNQAFLHRFEVFYWRERNDEVDFIIQKNGVVIAIEVKSNGEKNTSGLNKFKEVFHPKSAFIVGEEGLSAQEFLTMDIVKLFR